MLRLSVDESPSWPQQQQQPQPQSLPPMTALAGTQQARQPWVQMALPPLAAQVLHECLQLAAERQVPLQMSPPPQ